MLSLLKLKCQPLDLLVLEAVLASKNSLQNFHSWACSLQSRPWALARQVVLLVLTSHPAKPVLPCPLSALPFWLPSHRWLKAGHDPHQHTGRLREAGERASACLLLAVGPATWPPRNLSRLSGSWASALTTYSDLWVGPALCVKKARWASPSCSHLRSTGFKVKLGPTLPQRLPSWVTWAGRLRSSLPSFPICKQKLTRPSSSEEAGKTGKALRTLRSPLSRELPHFTSVLGLGDPEPPPPVHPSP